jgi:hypothetical protein
MNVRLRACVAVIAVMAMPLVAARAGADVEIDRCLDANVQAQSPKRDGKFGAAREQLKLCAVAGCPTLVRNDCSQRLDDLDSADAR